MAYDRSDGDPRSGLLQALKAEEQWAASYLKSELQESQINALKRYYGDLYGDEVEGRSQVTTREVYEIIEWLRPDLRRIFTSGDKVFEFEGLAPDADAYAQSATELVNHAFLRDNDGERELDAFIFDGLLQRVGVLACEWKEAEYSPVQESTGLNTLQAQALLNDPNTEIVDQQMRQGVPDEAHPDGRYFDLKIRRVAKPAKAEVFAIAPEDFRVAARTTDLETTRYAGDVVRMMRGEAKAKWPEYADEIDSHQGDTGGFNTDERRAERFRDLEGWDAGSIRAGQEGEAGEVEIMREYIRHDLDGDGIPELIRCYRLGDCLLEADEVDEHIYAHWTPISIPHRFFGLSVSDEAMDIQRTKTVLLRSMLDSVYQSVAPRIVANTKLLSAVGLDALLTVRPGVVIEADGPAGDAVFPLAVPDLSAGALNAMQWMDRVAESRTGVNRSAQPMDPDLLHDTARGVELLQNAASVRKEEIARNLAVGLRQLGMKLYRLLHKHQDQARSLKIAGQWREVDPRAWEADIRCTVSVGLGTGAREKQMMMLQMIQADQVAWVQAYGPATPVVTPQHLHNLVAEKLRVMGFKAPDRFFGDPVRPNPQTGQLEPFVPEPPPNPDQQKAEMHIQKLQMDMWAKQQETERKSGEAVLVAQIKQWSAQQEQERKEREALLAQDLKEREMRAEQDRQERQAQFEAMLATRQADFEERLALRQQKFEERMSANGGDPASRQARSTDVNFGGAPG